MWNPHERVQVFTSPLWYLVLAFARMFSGDPYLNVIIVSLVVYVSTIFVLKAIFRNNLVLLLSIILLSASTAFYDYTSSGLENVLAYFFIAVYILNYRKLFAFRDPHLNHKKESSFRMKVILLLFGLMICVRHDLVLLFLPSTIYAVFKNLKTLSIREWVISAFIAFFPLMLYSLFSLFYYGFPFPNTAYAKLNTHIDKIVLFRQGARYFISSLKYDTITPVVITAVLVISFLRQTEKYLTYLGCGVILSLFYIFYIGGDFMQGRFLSYAYMVSAIFILVRFSEVHTLHFIPAFIVICFYHIFYPHTPCNSPLHYSNKRIEWGIADERGFYFNQMSLYRYLARAPEDTIFPDITWAREGYEFHKMNYRVAIKEAVGVYGYHAGIDKIIVDPLALTDPLLARMPVTVNWWRIGHFWRNIPPGYIESIMTGSEIIVNPKINQYYKKLKIVTQNNRLFAPERLKTIIRFNIGAYDHLLFEE